MYNKQSRLWWLHQCCFARVTDGAKKKIHVTVNKKNYDFCSWHAFIFLYIFTEYSCRKNKLIQLVLVDVIPFRTQKLFIPILLSAAKEYPFFCSEIPAKFKYSLENLQRYSVLNTLVTFTNSCMMGRDLLAGHVWSPFNLHGFAPVWFLLNTPNSTWQIDHRTKQKISRM